MNNATSLHLACLYRAPKDLVEMILDFNPNSLLCQDSEGWTPIHVVLLYGNDEETAIMLIRRGGKEAVSIQSPIVGSPLHLAFRHGCSANIIQVSIWFREIYDSNFFSSASLRTLTFFNFLTLFEFWYFLSYTSGIIECPPRHGHYSQRILDQAGENSVASILA